MTGLNVVTMTNEQLSNAPVDENQGANSVAPIEEKMVPQSKVNELVGQTRVETRQKVLEELAKIQGNVPQAVAQAPVMQGAQPIYHDPISSNPQSSSQDLNTLLNQKFTEFQQRQQQEQLQYAQMMHAQEVAKNAFSKLDEVEKSNPGAKETILKNIPFDTAAGVYAEAAKLPNGGQVLLDLSNNPTKLLTMAEMINKFPNLAQQEFARLSGALSTADQKPNLPQEPLSQSKPSATGAPGNGSLSLSDLKRLANAI